MNNANPEVHGVNGILQAYNASFQRGVLLSGPTYASEILSMAEAIVSSKRWTRNNQSYLILLILTDGILNDMNKTIQRIISMSEKAVSIIIVGIGNANFR